MNDTTMLSAKELVKSGIARNQNITMIQVGMAPIDGLTIKGSAAETSNSTGTSGPGGKEQGVSANLHAKYTMGPVSIGYAEGGYQPDC